MGLFSLFNRKKEEKKQEAFEFAIDFKKHLVDDFFIVSIPVDWIPFESDRFRAKTKDDKLQMSIINYESKTQGAIKIDGKFFKDLKLELYDVLVTEGKYEPYDDLKVTDSFITKSFKVDEETQYYFTSARNIAGRVIITDMIVRESGEYNRKMGPLLQTINQLMTVK